METAEIIANLSTVDGMAALLAEEPLSAHSTFRVGGPAQVYAVPETIDAVRAIAGFCRTSDIPLYVLGSGSNLLIADDGVRGVVMRLGPKFSDVTVAEDGTIIAQAGATNNKIAKAALDHGLGGFEFAAGIPGSIGGAAVMNAGAYGGELKDVATAVIALSPSGTVVHLKPEAIGWDYRYSKMAEEGYIVLAVELKLFREDPVVIKERMDDLASQRSAKQPLDMPSAGSTFKRPPGHFAGKLIQDAGLQGFSVGGAQVSEKHAGFVVNTGNATATDVLALIDYVRAAVLEIFGVELQPEVKLWGF